MKTAFVTGGSGFVGRNLIRHLREKGVVVKALARSEGSRKVVEELGAKVVMGDLNDVQALENGVQETDVVFHSGAALGEWGDRAEFHRINVDGTRSLLEASVQAGVKRFIHVGTEAALAGENRILNADETQPRARKPKGIYPESKGKAEAVVLEFNGRGIETIVVRPRLIWGNDDTSVLPLLIEKVEAGEWMWVNQGDYLTSTCHVDNLIAGMLLAVEKGKPGEIYFLTDGAPVQFRDFVSRMMLTKGVEPGGKSVPRWLVGLMANVFEFIWKLFRIKKAPPVTRTAVALGCEEVTVNDAKARRELGYQNVISVDEGITAMGTGSK